MNKITYDSISKFFLEKWYFAIPIVFAIVIMAIPQLRDGVQVIFKPFKEKPLVPLVITTQFEEITFDQLQITPTMDLVKVNSVKHIHGVWAEHSYLKYYYPQYDFGGQELRKISIGSNSEEYFDIIELKDKKSGDVVKKIYFDITSFFGESTDPLTIEEVNEKKIRRFYEQQKSK